MFEAIKAKIGGMLGIDSNEGSNDEQIFLSNEDRLSIVKYNLVDYVYKLAIHEEDFEISDRDKRVIRDFYQGIGEDLVDSANRILPNDIFDIQREDDDETKVEDENLAFLIKDIKANFEESEAKERYIGICDHIVDQINLDDVSKEKLAEIKEKDEIGYDYSKLIVRLSEVHYRSNFDGDNKYYLDINNFISYYDLNEHLNDLWEIKYKNRIQNGIFDDSDRVVRLGQKRFIGESIDDQSDRCIYLNGSEFNVYDYVGIGSPIDIGREVTRSITENRSYATYNPVVIDGVIYNDILVKGIGRKIGKTLYYEDGSGFVTDIQLDNGRDYYPRFINKKMQGMVDYDFGSGHEETSNGDKLTSEKLENAGLRTRRRIFKGKLKTSTRLPMQDEMREIQDSYDEDTPIIEVWAMRCSSRIRDLVKSHPAADAHEDVESKYVTTFFENWLDKNMLRNYLEEEGFYSKLPKLSAESHVYFNKLKDLISERALKDSDARFQALGEEGENLEYKDFFTKYLHAFSQVWGEQAAIIYSEGAHPIENLWNYQNVSLLAELVDHDVTYFDKSHKNKPEYLSKQINFFLGAISRLCNIFELNKAISDRFNSNEVFKLFFESYIRKLKDINEKDLEMALDTFATIDREDEGSLIIHLFNGEPNLERFTNAA
jgi:hypothetical protein